MSTATIDLSEKIRLYLAARGYKVSEYVVAPEGKAWKDNAGQFTIKSRLRFTKPDGLLYTRSFKAINGNEPPSEEGALKDLFFTYLKKSGIHLCGRCGGAGGRKEWPGFTCFDCNGTGIDPDFNLDKALTRSLKGEDFEGDYVAKVAARKAKEAADHARFIEEEAKARIECAREFKAANANRIARAKSCLAILGLGSTGEWGEKLRYLLSFESSESSIPEGGNDFLRQIDEICGKIEARDAENARQAAISKHVGKQGERQEFTARVQFVKEFENEYGVSHLTVLADDDGNVLKYWNTINLADPLPDFPKNKRPAARGERVSFAAAVVEHDYYNGIPQTQIQRVTKARLAD